MKSKSKNYSVNVSESIKVVDKVHTNKRWFNGMKFFYTVKVLPITKDSGRDKPVREP